MTPKPEASKLRLFSIGRVANNKEMSSNKIQVTPIEALTMLDGDIVSSPTDTETTGTDAAGIAYSAKVKTDAAIEAEWFPMNSNRRTAPDVRRGERVVIWQYADTETYYWTETGWDDHLRKLETVVYSFSATMDEEADSLDPANCYSLEVSTHMGHVTLKTSKANGEYCVYALQINTKDGRVILTDELGNEFEVDSKNTMIQFTNADKTVVQLNKRKIVMSATDAIEASADQSISFKTKDFRIDCETWNLQCNTGNVKGTITFQDEVTFQKKTMHTGIQSSLPVRGPSETLN